MGLGDLTRRGFLKSGLALAGIPLYASCKGNSEYWEFLKRQTIEFTDAQCEQALNFVPLGPETTIPLDTKDGQLYKERVSPEIEAEIIKRGFDKDLRISLTITEQEYGMPEEMRYAEPMLDYSKRAVEYAHSRVKNLRRHSLDWIILKHDQNFETAYNQNAYIGRMHFTIIRVNVENKTNPDKSFKRAFTKPGNSSINRTVMENGSDVLKWWYLFLETGRNAVNAVFSEYIPLTTLPTTIKYSNNGFKDEARAADEGLAEAASYILGMDISNEFKIPNGKSIVEETTKLLSNQSYKYVPKAIDWMKKNSIDGALDLYMESPKKFLQAIGAEGK